MLRAALHDNTQDVEFVAVNDLTDPATLAYLLKYDSVHGTLPNEVSSGEGKITVDGKDIKVYASPDPAKIPWEDLGRRSWWSPPGGSRQRDKAAAHLHGTVEQVIDLRARKEVDLTVCMGVNEKDFDPSKHQVISNASCTTNCLAPMARVLHENFTITRGIMTTIHSYTNDQVILDLPHKDLRRARAAGLSMIPTTTGAAKAVGLVLPELKGKFDGISVRVPTPNVSLVDLVFNTEKETSAEEINDALRKAADGDLKGILTCSEEQLVSIDFNNSPYSSIVDTTFTRSVDPKMHKVLSWYDNEYGYSNRVVDLIRYIAKVKS